MHKPPSRSGPVTPRSTEVTPTPSFDDLDGLQAASDRPGKQASAEVIYCRSPRINSSASIFSSRAELYKENLKEAVTNGKLKKFLYIMHHMRFLSDDQAEAQGQAKGQAKDYNLYKGDTFLPHWKSLLLNLGDESKGLGFKQQGFTQTKLRHTLQRHVNDSSPSESEWASHPLDILMGLMCQQEILCLEEAGAHLEEAKEHFLNRNATKAVSSLYNSYLAMPNTDERLEKTYIYLKHHAAEGSLQTILDSIPQSESFSSYIDRMALCPEENPEGLNFIELRKVRLNIEKIENMIKHDWEVMVFDGAEHYGNFSCCTNYLIFNRKLLENLYNKNKALEDGHEKKVSTEEFIKKEAAESRFQKMETVANKAIGNYPGIGWIIMYLNFSLRAAFLEEVEAREKQEGKNKTEGALAFFSQLFGRPESSAQYASAINEYRWDSVRCLLIAKELLPHFKQVAHNALNGDKIHGLSFPETTFFSLSDLYEKEGIEHTLNEIKEHMPNSGVSFEATFEGVYAKVQEEVRLVLESQQEAEEEHSCLTSAL